MKTNCTTHHYACDCREEMYQSKISSLEKTIEALKEVIKKQDEALGFYGKTNSWSWFSSRSSYDVIINDSSLHEENESIGLDVGVIYGGKLARQTRKEVEEMVKKIEGER